MHVESRSQRQGSLGSLSRRDPGRAGNDTRAAAGKPAATADAVAAAGETVAAGKAVTERFGGLIWGQQIHMEWEMLIGLGQGVRLLCDWGRRAWQQVRS